MESREGRDARWTFLTNHAHVLLCLAEDPGMRLRDVAARIGITERATQRILADLIAADYVVATREGRRNHYEVHPDRPMRHAVEAHATIGALVDALGHGPGGDEEPGGDE